MLSLRGQIAQRRRTLRESQREPITDPDRYWWFAPSCRHNLPAGHCTECPRARSSQKPPAGDWRTWLFLGGRGTGKTMAGAQWVRWLAESGKAPRIALVAPT